ncbi:MAG: CTP synthase (UTP-ammonia lyase) [Crocinitomicaceae bacterium]|jgi:CTP synthase (UTP-ammonia lyase)
MQQNLKIAIIGDYNFTYNSHHATNLAIDHASNFLEIDVSYYWVKLSEVLKFRSQQFNQYDGFWIAPGPIKNEFFLHGIIKDILGKQIPTLITGEGYRTFLDALINTYQLNQANEKLVSDNLVEGQQFEKIMVTPHSKPFIQLYENHSKVELTSSRYSLYPKLINSLQDDIIDIEAYNQFEDPEIISLKNHPFFVSCSFCPQISSTREIPHPMIYTFMKTCLAVVESASAKQA